MTIAEYKKEIRNKLKRYASSDDAYLCMFFSKEDDEYYGHYNNIKSVDALLVIKILIDKFEIDADALALSLKNDKDDIQ